MTNELTISILAEVFLQFCCVLFEKALTNKRLWWMTWAKGIIDDIEINLKSISQITCTR